MSDMNHHIKNAISLALLAVATIPAAWFMHAKHPEDAAIVTVWRISFFAIGIASLLGVGFDIFFIACGYGKKRR